MEKTAMQQLFESIKSRRYDYTGTQWAPALDGVIDIIKSYLPIERQQIQEAFKDGISTNINESTPAEYFDNHFTQKQDTPTLREMSRYKK